MFAGQRQDPFYIDLGAAFDSLNFGTTPVLTAAEDDADTKNQFGVDMLAGFNVNTIAIELAGMLTPSDGGTVGTTAAP